MRRGFTLVEVLVVVAIIGVLATLVLTWFSYGRDEAKITRAKVETQQLMRAAELVYNDYGYYPNDSHSDPICPRDIVIAPGVSWSKYTTLCNDPWGHPYEWDNVCDAGGGTLIKRSPHTNDPLCPLFSDDRIGPVGVTFAGPDGVNDNCTGDDLCTGTRGHAVYGWRGEYVAPDSGPMCVAQIAECSGLSPLSCESRAGCSLGAPGCSGSASVTCSSFGSPGLCETVAGCGWTATQSCNGTVSCSAYSGDEGGCLARGCSFDGGVCSGPASCVEFEAGLCQTTLGCSLLLGGTCNGAPTCLYDNASACGAAGCTWGSTSCTGSASSCGASTDALSCGAQAGCEWQP